jgi:hypothetical protein
LIATSDDGPEGTLPAETLVEVLEGVVVRRVAAPFGDHHRVELHREAPHLDDHFAIVVIDEIERHVRRDVSELAHANQILPHRQRTEEKAAVRSSDTEAVRADELHLSFLNRVPAESTTMPRMDDDPLSRRSSSARTTTGSSVRGIAWRTTVTSVRSPGPRIQL